jgi:tetratricopeptide (TPR) repeat protein
MFRRFFAILPFFLTVFLSFAALAQNAKPAPDNPDLVAADRLYKAGKFVEAADKYQALLKTDANLVTAESGLIESLLRQQKIDEASAEAVKALGAQPNSAALLAAMGDVQFRLAKMSAAETSYHKALQIDRRELRAYLGLIRLYRAYSLYRRAYEVLMAAYQIAPDDPEVQRWWFSRLSRRERLAAIEAYLAGPHPDDSEETVDLQHALEFLKATADKPVHACRLVSKVEHTDTKLQRMFHDPQHIVGFGLAVKLNDHNTHLLLDTGASGILIGRKSAEKAGLTHISETRFYGIGDKGSQGGYIAVADHIRIGELEFADCVVTVSDRMPLSDEDGLIGSDVFSSYLIDIDFPTEKLKLSPLPKRPDETVAPTALNSEGEEGSNPGNDADEAPASQKADATAETSKTVKAAPAPVLPKDRYVAPEMKNWTPVFRFGHQLLIETEVNDSKPMLFLIDTGASRNFLSTRAGREVTKINSDSNMRVSGLSGNVTNVYSADKATLQFSHFFQKDQNVMTFDLSNLSRNTGTEVSGILGFQLLGKLQVKIDYRDGLVDFSYDPSQWQIKH